MILLLKLQGEYKNCGEGKKMLDLELEGQCPVLASFHYSSLVRSSWEELLLDTIFICKREQQKPLHCLITDLLRRLSQIL
jgi:hypothetical protein